VLNPSRSGGPGAGPDLLRRVLLGLVTALIVARPLVLGEDPGLLVRLSDASNLVLTLLWLAAAVGWAVWRAWSRQGTWYACLVDAGLLAVVTLQFLDVPVAAYRHPAYLIAWEWLALLVVFCLVRQLARTPGDNQRLLAAVLASGVSLSAYAVYQYTVEMPQLREQFASQTEELRKVLAREGIEIGANDPRLTIWSERIRMQSVYATFAHPNSFAGFLALLLPAAVGGALMCHRARGWSTARMRDEGRGMKKGRFGLGSSLIPHPSSLILVAAGALLMGTALCLTLSKGAIGGSLLVGAAVLVLEGRKRGFGYGSRRLGRRDILLLLLGGLALAVLLLWMTHAGGLGLGLARRSLDKRLDYWSATWRMITDPNRPGHFWLGVGPGNFGRYYPQYMAETAYEQVTDPHNFALEMWATGGIVGLLALLATLALFFWGTRRAWTGPNDEDQPPEAGTAFATRWEFYLGGVGGLIVGFMLWASNQTGDQVIVGGVTAGVRSLIWFASFALFETIPWTRSARRLALTAGVAALLLNLTVSGGISFPSVAQPLWFMAALAWNTLPPRPVTRFGGSWLGRSLPVPVFAAGCLIYAFFVFVPVWGCLGYLREAAAEIPRWTEKFDPEWRKKLAEGPNAGGWVNLVNRNRTFLDQAILRPLRKAVEQDSGNAYPCSELASWYGERWKLSPTIELRGAAVGMARAAQKLDPEGREGYLAEYRLNLLFAQLSERETRQFYERAAQALAQVVQRDPTEARLHFQLAQVLFQADKPAEARRQAEEARRLDRVSTEPSRRLTDSQRKQIEKWLPPGSP
jgi:O-antigen ligase/polysaccharide polymerase Wzy-like membrane protein/tetratricopeptide repeat protein